MYVCMSVCMYVRMYVFMYVCRPMYICIYVCIYIYACTYMCMCLCMCVCIYVYRAYVCMLRRAGMELNSYGVTGSKGSSSKHIASHVKSSLLLLQPKIIVHTA